MGIEHWIATPSLKQAIWLGKGFAPPSGLSLRAYFANVSWNTGAYGIQPDDPRPERIRSWLETHGHPGTISGNDVDDSFELFLFSLKEGRGQRPRPGWVVEDAWTGMPFEFEPEMTREEVVAGIEKALSETAALAPVGQKGATAAIRSWIQEHSKRLPKRGIPVYEGDVLIGHAHFAGVEDMTTEEDVAAGRLSFSHQYEMTPIRRRFGVDNRPSEAACPECGFRTLRRREGRWVCGNDDDGTATDDEDFVPCGWSGEPEFVVQASMLNDP